MGVDVRLRSVLIKRHSIVLVVVEDANEVGRQSQHLLPEIIKRRSRYTGLQSLLSEDVVIELHPAAAEALEKHRCLVQFEFSRHGRGPYR